MITYQHAHAHHPSLLPSILLHYVDAYIDISASQNPPGRHTDVRLAAAMPFRIPRIPLALLVLVAASGCGSWQQILRGLFGSRLSRHRRLHMSSICLAIKPRA
jgi:hypothetical protein